MTAPSSLRTVSVPIDIGADDARALAARELARAIYDAHRPTLLQRIGSWLDDRFTDLLRAASGAGFDGRWGLLLVVVLLVGLALLVRLQMGRTARSAATGVAVLDAVVRTAAEHREAAAGAEAAGRHDEAVREWMRALVRGLEERTVLDARGGRTAGEAAREIAAALPPAGEAAGVAARLFDETVYGGRDADADVVARVRAADEQARATRPVAAP